MNQKPYFIIYYLIFIIYSLLFSGCGSNTVTPNDPNLIYSASELICDYHDSVNVYNPIFDSVFVYYRKMILNNFSSKTFNKVRITGTIDSYSLHDTSRPYTVYVTLGLDKDTGNIFPQPGDTAISIAPALMHITDFDDTFNVTYESSESFFVLFNLFVSNPLRGDYIKVKNLKIVKSN